MYVRLLSIAFVTLLLFAFQNCGEGFEAATSLNLSSTGNYPTPNDIPELKDWNDPFPAGVEHADCMNSDYFNMCLIYKDPVSANGGAFSPKLTTRSSSSTIESKIMTYGIRVPSSGALANDNYEIKDVVKADASANGGSWKFPYKQDTNHYVAQVAAFYWLNRQVTYMKEVSGAFYAEGLKSPVYAYESSVANNAYFDGEAIVMGYVKFGDDTSFGDIGLDAGVLAHEAGHSNFYQATGGALLSGDCPDKNGCFDGIHEGQGDVHTFILFPENDSLGGYFINDIDGLRSPASIKDQGLTAQDLFDRLSGESHDMGEAYASLWWEAWEKAKNDDRQQELEALFTDHLAGLGVSDNFTTALEVIEAMAVQSAPDNAAQISADFREEYTRMLIDLP